MVYTSGKEPLMEIHLNERRMVQKVLLRVLPLLKQLRYLLEGQMTGTAMVVNCGEGTPPPIRFPSD